MSRSLALQSADLNRVLIAQAVLVVVVALAHLAASGPAAGVAAAYGGGVALLSSGLLGRRVQRATEVARTRPGQETMVLYFGAVQRFVMVLVLFGVGMGSLGLSPAPLLVGFGLAQLGYFAPGVRPTSETDRAASRVEKWG